MDSDNLTIETECIACFEKRLKEKRNEFWRTMHVLTACDQEVKSRELRTARQYLLDENALPTVCIRRNNAPCLHNVFASTTRWTICKN